MFLLLSTIQSDAYTQQYIVEEVNFTSHEAKLAGTIVAPKDKQVHVAVVFVHGSGKQTRIIYLAQRFASDGIAALVYDKPGVGKSGGV